MDELISKRKELDEIDKEILSLLNKRMEIASHIIQCKKERKQKVTDEKREAQIFERLEGIAKHPILKENIENIYHSIIDTAKAIGVFESGHSLPFKKIGIIGMGLMGGSLAKALKAKSEEIKIATYRCNASDNKLAREHNVIDEEYAHLEDLIKNSELLIIATPISSVIPLAREIHMISKKTKQPTLLIDISSVKSSISAEFEKLSDEFLECIPTHPMAGSEKSGFIHSQAKLFIHRPWIITSHKKNKEKNIQSIKEFISYIGAHPLCMKADIHDRRAALVSHFPSFLAFSFLRFLLKIDPEAKEMCGPGFASFTRIAHQNPTLRSEIMQNNSEEIQKLLTLWMEEIPSYKSEAVK